MIAIVDYQVGNTGNVRRAFSSLGEEAFGKEEKSA